MRYKDKLGIKHHAMMSKPAFIHGEEKKSLRKGSEKN